MESVEDEPEPIQDPLAREVMRLWRAHDEVGAFSIVYARLVPLLRAKKASLKEPDLFEDGLQAVCIKFLGMLRKGDEIRNLDATLRHCANWVFVDLFRGDKRANSLGGTMSEPGDEDDSAEVGPAAPASDDPAIQLADQQASECRDRVIAQLYLDRPEEMKILADLVEAKSKQDEGQEVQAPTTLKEVARVLGRPYGALRNQISRFYKYSRELCRNLCGHENCSLADARS